MSRCRSTIISTSRRQTFFMNVKARSSSASLGTLGSLADGIRHVGRRHRRRPPALRPRRRPAVRGRAPAATSSARHCRAAAGRSRFRAPRARRAPPCRTSRSRPSRIAPTWPVRESSRTKPSPHAVEGVAAVIRRRAAAQPRFWRAPAALGHGTIRRGEPGKAQPADPTRRHERERGSGQGASSWSPWQAAHADLTTDFAAAPARLKSSIAAGSQRSARCLVPAALMTHAETPENTALSISFRNAAVS